MLTLVCAPGRIRTYTALWSLVTPIGQRVCNLPRLTCLRHGGANQSQHLKREYPEQDSNLHDHRGPGESNSPASTVSATRAKGAGDPTTGPNYFTPILVSDTIFCSAEKFVHALSTDLMQFVPTDPLPQNWSPALALPPF